MVRAVVFKILFFVLLAGVSSNPQAFAEQAQLSRQDLAFLKAVKQETLNYIHDQKEITEAFKMCIERRICDAKFQMVNSDNLPFEMVFDSKDELLTLIRKMHTKFRILSALRNRTQYDSIKSQGLVFLAPMAGLPVMRFTSYGPYGRAEMQKVFSIIEDDLKTKEEFKQKIKPEERMSYQEDYHANYNIELLAIDTYETQISQMLSALPMFNELMFAEVGRRDTELSEATILDRMNRFITNLNRTKDTVEAIAEDNVVDTFMFPSMVNAVLLKNPNMTTNFEKLSAYALARKNLLQSFVDKFTNTMTWAILGCFAGSIIVPKAAPLIMGICGGIGFSTMAVMAAKTLIEMERINPMVRVGLMDPSNMSHLQSVLAHQVIMSFIMGSGALPNVIKLAKAQTFSQPAVYYSQMVRNLSSRTTNQQAWRTYLQEHARGSKQELINLTKRFSKANAKDLAARVPTSSLAQAYNLIPQSMLVKFSLFEIFTLSDSLRLQMYVL